MAQHDYNLINQSGADFRADLNNALSAIVSNNSGSTEPATKFAYEWWVDESTGKMKLRNSANNAWITMPFNIGVDNSVDINVGTVNGITSFSFASGSTVTTILDEDNLSTNSATALATQQSIKAYVDAQVTAQDLDITDGSTVIGIDLDSQTLSMLGGTGITSVASGQAVTFSIGQAVATSDNVVFNQVTAAVVGNASTATTLQNARNISGIAFDGSANITLNTSTITENTNLYFTNERVDDRVAAFIQNGTGISWVYADGSNTFTPTISLTPFNTGQLSEGSNLYYTDARARAAISESSTQLAYNSTTGVLTYTQGNTDTVAEGSNLYYTDARSNAAIDTRVNKTFIDNLNVVAATTSGLAGSASVLASARTIALTGDVVGSLTFNGSSDVSMATVIQANSVTLGTDTVGSYIKTITGTANKITVSGSGSETAEVTLTLPDDVQIADSLTVAGNLTVNGTLTSLDTTNLDIEDNLFQLNAGLTGSPVNDSGMLINRGNQNNGIFMWDESADKFTMGLTTADGTSTGNITLASLGTLVANVEGNVTGTIQTAAQPNITSVGTLTALTVDNFTIDGTTLALSSGDMTLDVAGDIILDADGGEYKFLDGGSESLVIGKTGGSPYIYPTAQDSDLIFLGNDGGVGITALTLDMSDAGTAIFNHDIKVGSGGIVQSDTINNRANNANIIYRTGSTTVVGNNATALVVADSGAVTMAGTLSSGAITTSGNLTASQSVLSIINNDIRFKTSGDQTMLRAVANGAVEIMHANSTKLATTSGGVSVTGGLDVGTVTSTGNLVLNQDSGTIFIGADLDLRITHSGSAGTITNNTGNLTLDVAGDIKLDADSSNIYLADNGTDIGLLSTNNQDLNIRNLITDKDIYFQGKDGSSTITALTLDMSEAGRATFNDNVNLGDTKKLVLGSGDDLQIYHDGSNSWIDDTGTGDLILKTNGARVSMLAGSDTMFQANKDGEVNLYYDNARKLATTSGGVSVTGTTTTTNLTINDGVQEFDKPSVKGFRFLHNDAGNDLSIQQGDTNNANYVTKFNISSAGNCGIGTTSPSVLLDTRLSTTTGKVAEFHNSAGYGIGFTVESDGGVNTINSETNQSLAFATNGASNERMRLDASGNLGLGNTNPNLPLTITANSGANALAIRARASADDYGFMQFYNNAGTELRGQIYNHSGAIGFSTGSSGTERMRLDSSGELFVGKTASSNTTKGFTVDQDGLIQSTKTGSGGQCVFLNRQDSEGIHILFRQGNSSVGSISVISGNNLTISGLASNHAGLSFATNAILPVSEGSETNGVCDLGATSEKFKDLHLSGNAYVGASGFLSNNQGEFIKLDNVDDTIEFSTAGSERMRLDSAGTMYLGTTSPTLHSAHRGIVFENGSLTNDVTRGASKSINLAQNAVVDAGNTWSYLATDEASLYQQFGGDHYFFTAPVGSANSDITFTSRIIIKRAGNVGIGDLSPDNKLHVNSGTTNVVAKFESTDTTAAIQFKDNSGEAEIGCTGNDLTFFPAGAEKMRLDSSGSLLVGVTSYGNSGGGTSIAKGLIKLSSDTTSTATKMFFTSANGAVGNIQTNGSATQFNTSSDARLKNVTGEARGLEVINELNPVAYNWKVDNKPSEGLLAQEVIKIVPDAVSTNEEDKYYQMDYSKLVVHLVAGMKEQQTQIEELKTQINNLKGE